MPDDTPVCEDLPDDEDRTVLVDQDGVICRLERVLPDCRGFLHLEPCRSITVVLSGGPVEVVDERDHVLGRTTLMTGQVIRDDGGLPPPFRLCNLADRALVLVVIELPEPVPAST
ncbi:hypothetical protein BJY24_001035 [Nocardia transvalensis]|uniref:Quercetin dioxygenase-like cupin family protein n=1 Tax=Nocardia transvalensis TaxID=37333 RepID=A0A7W9UGD5_9NOCA|nr:hypothetical protein [Nocardia transvalensis]MBB5912168.1 hypothetical protein [Nocardia transvalensis]